jgi:RNA polymerase sigma-70 factor (ECF subfamily)
LQHDLGRLAEGDRLAFDAVFRTAWPFVLELARRSVLPEDAEEIAQRTLLALFERASDFDPERDAAGWIAALAFWEIRTERTRRRRDRARRVSAEVLAEEPSAEPKPDEAAESKRLAESFRAIVAELAPGDAEALRAFALDERPAGSTYRKRLERALGRLRRRWKDRYG